MHSKLEKVTDDVPTHTHTWNQPVDSRVQMVLLLRLQIRFRVEALDYDFICT